MGAFVMDEARGGYMSTVFSRRVEEVRAEARAVETTSKTG
jgi:hypothetical protein